MRWLAALATFLAAAFSACAPTDAAHGSSWIEPDHYMVDAVFSGAWFYSGWFELEIANGKIAS